MKMMIRREVMRRDVYTKVFEVPAEITDPEEAEDWIADNVELDFDEFTIDPNDFHYDEGLDYSVVDEEVA